MNIKNKYFWWLIFLFHRSPIVDELYVELIWMALGLLSPLINHNFTSTHMCICINHIIFECSINILRRNIDTEEDSTTCINFWYAIKNRMYNTRYERFCLPNQKLINKNAAGRSRKSLIERNWRKLVYTNHAIRIFIILYYMWVSCWCKTIFLSTVPLNSKSNG